MPKITPPKESLEGKPPLPPDVYSVRLDGFKPKKSKAGDTVNANPVMKVINHPTLNDRNVFDNLNSAAGWVMKDFCHAFGLQMDNGSLPGEFPGTGDDPASWGEYVGPLKGRTAKIQIVRADNGRGGTKDAIKRYFCAIPNCQERHSESLV